MPNMVILSNLYSAYYNKEQRCYKKLSLRLQNADG